MRSPMIESLSCIPNEEKNLYTEMQVLKSNAGFYVGTMYNNPEGFEEPGSRDSGYFATREEAEQELSDIMGGKQSRMTP